MPIRIPRSGLAGSTPLPLGGVNNVAAGSMADASLAAGIGGGLSDAFGNVAKAFAIGEKIADDKASKDKAEQDKIDGENDTLGANSGIGSLVGEINTLNGELQRGEIDQDGFEKGVADKTAEIESGLSEGGLFKFRRSASLRVPPLMSQSREDFIGEQRRQAGVRMDTAISQAKESVSADNYADTLDSIDELLDGSSMNDADREARRVREHPEVKSMARAATKVDLSIELEELYGETDSTNVLEMIGEVEQIIQDEDNGRLFDDDELGAMQSGAVGQVINAAALSARTTEEKLALKSLLGERIDPREREQRALLDSLDAGLRTSTAMRVKNTIDDAGTTDGDVDDTLLDILDMVTAGVVNPNIARKWQLELMGKSREIRDRAAMRAIADEMVANPARSQSVEMTPAVTKEYNLALARSKETFATSKGPGTRLQIFVDGGDTDAMAKLMVQDVRQGVMPPIYSQPFMAWAHGSDSKLVAQAARVWQEVTSLYGGNLDTIHGTGPSAALRSVDKDTAAWLSHAATNLELLDTGDAGAIEALRNQFDLAKKAGASGTRGLSGGGSGVRKSLNDRFTTAISGIDERSRDSVVTLAERSIKPGHRGEFLAEFDRLMADGTSTEDQAFYQAVAIVQKSWRAPGGGLGVEGMRTKNPPDEEEAEAFKVEMSQVEEITYVGLSGDQKISVEEFLAGVEFSPPNADGERVVLYHPVDTKTKNRLAGKPVSVKYAGAERAQLNGWTPSLELSPTVQERKKVSFSSVAVSFNERFDQHLNGFRDSDAQVVRKFGDIRLSRKLRGSGSPPSDVENPDLAGIDLTKIMERRRQYYLGELKSDATEMANNAIDKFGLKIKKGSIDEVILALEEGASEDNQFLKSQPVKYRESFINAIFSNVSSDHRPIEIEDTLNRLKAFRELEATL